MNIETRIENTRKRADELIGTMEKRGKLEEDIKINYKIRDRKGVLNVLNPSAALLVLGVNLVFFGGLGYLLSLTLWEKVKKSYYHY